MAQREKIDTPASHNETRSDMGAGAENDVDELAIPRGDLIIPHIPMTPIILPPDLRHTRQSP